MYRILVVDDHDLIRVGVCQLLNEVAGVTVVGEAASGEQALELVGSIDADVVFMDLRMPGMGGGEAARRIMFSYPHIKVIILTAVNDDEYPRRMLRAGAAAYMTKRADSDEVAKALQTVMAGEVYISPELAQQMVAHQANVDNSESPFAALSEREVHIAQMITSGHRAAEIAAMLNISAKTINTHKYRVYEKVNVTNDVELTLLAVKHGFVDPDSVLCFS